jgi:hypothetical protein
MTVVSDTSSGVVSLGDLLRLNPKPPSCLIEPGLLPEQGILFCGGEPKVGKSGLDLPVRTPHGTVCRQALADAPAPRPGSG